MFTSEPSLAQRIERMIGDTPIIDSHTHLRADRPNAPDLAALIGHRAIEAQLRSVGMAAGDFDSALPADERVRRAIPYLGQIRNTSASWCLFRIFRDLYDFEDPTLTEGNYRNLFDKVAATALDPAWTRSVLQVKSNLWAVVTDRADQEAGPTEPNLFHHSLDLRHLLDSLHGLGRARPTSSTSLQAAVRDLLNQKLVGPSRFVVLERLSGRGFDLPEPSRVDAALAKADGTLTAEEADVVADQAAWSVLAWHHEHRRPLRIVVGANPGQIESWASSMSRTLVRFAGAKVEFLSHNDAIAHQVTWLASVAPNAYAPGDGWRTLSPLAIEHSVGHRVQLAPMTKIGGFASGAENVEWVYGTLQVVRKAMAASLARMVDARFFEEDEVPPLLRRILHDTPFDLFGLGVGG
jgi:glucuronate isomerase